MMVRVRVRRVPVGVRSYRLVGSRVPAGRIDLTMRLVSDGSARLVRQVARPPWAVQLAKFSDLRE